MNLRLMGSSDLVSEWATICETLGLSMRIYPQRRGSGSRLYADIDDRQAAALAERVRSAKSDTKTTTLRGGRG